MDTARGRVALKLNSPPDTGKACAPLPDTFALAVASGCGESPKETVGRGTFVGLFDLDQWHRWLAEGHALLSTAERHRVASRRAAADREALTLAYALHRTLLGHVLGYAPCDVPIGRDDAGCPSLPQYLAVSTSLSHAGRRAVAVAITRTGPVGVDLEEAGRAVVMAEIAEQVCHPDDTAALTFIGGQVTNDAMLALWVRKEAFLKAAGIGLQKDMNTFAAAEGALLPLPQGGWSQVRMLDAGPEWTAAVACAPSSTLACTWLHPRPGLS